MACRVLEGLFIGSTAGSNLSTCVCCFLIHFLPVVRILGLAV